MTYLPGVRRITRGQDRLFALLHPIILATCCHFYAGLIALGGRTAFEVNNYGHWQPKGTPILGADSRQFDISVIFPLTDGALDSMVANSMPHYIDIQFLTQIESRTLWPKGPHYQTTTEKAMVINYITPVFVTFYETIKDWLEKNCGKIDNWPGLWRFGRVIRNAVVHDGKIDMRGKGARPVQWYHISYGPKDNGRAIIGTDLAFADILILIIEMSDELDRLGCPI